MTKEAIKAECARLGRPIPRTKADLEFLVLAMIAERDGKDALQSTEPPKKPVGKPEGLSPFLALLLSTRVADLMKNPGMSAVKACKHICEGLAQDARVKDFIGTPETLRTKISRLRSERSKNIKDEKFKAKFLRDRDGFLVAALLYGGGKAEDKMRQICEIANEYLGEDTTEATIKRIREIRIIRGRHN